MAARPLKVRSEAARNERRKLEASGLNALALSVSVVGVLQPIFAKGVGPDGLMRIVVALLTSYGLHQGALAVADRMED